jgi:hypothetical protein
LVGLMDHKPNRPLVIAQAPELRVRAVAQR